MYYYFVGSYIESGLSPTEKEVVIKRVFENIHNDVNYNIALFLAYKLNIEYQIIPLDVYKRQDTGLWDGY